MLLIRSRHRFYAVLGMAVLLWVIVGCGSNSSSTDASSKPTTKAASDCAAAVGLKSSLEDLKDVNVRQDGVEALTSALTDVKTELGTAKASASSALQPAVEQVQTAVDTLGSATAGLTKDNLTQKAPGITAALRQVKTATSALTTTVAKRCPGS